MIKKAELIESVANYKATMKTPNNSTIVENFGKMYQYLVYTKKDEIPTELWLVLVLETVREACIAANRANMDFRAFKELTSNLRNTTVSKVIDLVKLIGNQLKEGDSNAYTVNMHKLFALLFQDEKDPTTLLYCWRLYYNRVEDGRNFIESGKEKFRELLKASSDEEIDEVLEEKAITPSI